MVHLATLNVQVAFGERTVIGSLCRCLIGAAHSLERVVHHVAHTTVIGIATVGVIYLDGNNLYRDCIGTHKHKVLCGKGNGFAPKFCVLVGGKKRDDNLVGLIHRLVEIEAVILDRSFS